MAILALTYPIKGKRLRALQAALAQHQSSSASSFEMNHGAAVAPPVVQVAMIELDRKAATPPLLRPYSSRLATSSRDAAANALSKRHVEEDTDWCKYTPPRPSGHRRAHTWGSSPSSDSIINKWQFIPERWIADRSAYCAPG